MALRLIEGKVVQDPLLNLRNRFCGSGSWIEWRSVECNHDNGGTLGNRLSNALADWVIGRLFLSAKAARPETHCHPTQNTQQQR